jgi:thioredoxin 1
MSGIVEIQRESDFEAIIAATTPVLVDFWAPWCGPCVRVAPVLGELAKELGGQVRFAKLNVDEHPEIASRFSVQGIPTMILFRAGVELDRVVGLAPKIAFKRWLLYRAA